MAGMMLGPGLYSEIGKKARDLLYRDYQTDQKFMITTYSASGVAMTASGTKKDEFILGEIQSLMKNKNITLDIKAKSDSNILATVTVDEIAMPGLKTIFSFILPDQRSGMVELRYFHPHAGVNASIGLTANPIVNFAGVLGSKTFAVGADVAFNTATGNFTKYNAGLNITNTDLIASLAWNNKGDSLNASYYHLVNPFTSTAVGAEVTHSFSSNENIITFGTQHALDSLTLIKARFNNYGRASALIQHEWRPRSFLTLSGEVDTKAVEKTSKVGLSLVLRP